MDQPLECKYCHGPWVEWHQPDCSLCPCRLFPELKKVQAKEYSYVPPKKKVIVIIPNMPSKKTKRIKRANARKQLPKLYKQQNGMCFYCGIETEIEKFSENDHSATVDHFNPLSKGGDNSKANLVMACKGCNSLKADMPPQNFLDLLRSRL